MPDEDVYKGALRSIMKKEFCEVFRSPILKPYYHKKMLVE